jgi:hypothetical protein
MKKIIIALVVLSAVVSTAGNAHAIGAFLSYWNGEDIDNGYGAGIKHKFQIVPIIGVEARASWLSFSDKDVNLYPLEAAGRASFGLFYGGLGGGYYIFSGKNTDMDDAFGGFLFAGIEVTLAKLGVFGELKYTWVESKIGDLATVSGNGVGINAGVLFGW